MHNKLVGNIVALFSALFVILGLGGCITQTSQTGSNQETLVGEAIALIRGNQAECVIVRDGVLAVVERGRGVSPLLNIYDNPESRKRMEGGTVVDKVIGRAAAFIAINGGAVHVHGEVMSEDAEELLKRHGITTSATLMVPKILNRNRDGLCPLEQSVLGLEAPEEALAALRRRVAELSGKVQN